MLKSLQIKDYALIENVFAEFESGLNIITGETGAGKSIIIDALGLILGERASTEVVRKGSEKAIVEGIFDVKHNLKIKSILDENEIEFNDQMIVRREISLKGTNRCFVNDSPVPLLTIKELGNYLVDLHGQHEHQSLLRTETHIEMLDELILEESLIQKFEIEKSKLQQLNSELRELRKRENLLKEKRELYDFQAKEIDEVSPNENEDTELESELNILENSEKLVELTTASYSMLFDDEVNINDLLGEVRNKIEELNEIDSSFKERIDEAESALVLINDIAEFIRAYRDRIEHDPEKLELMRSRLNSINRLKKKYGGSIEAILELRQKLSDELDLAENFSDRISELKNKIDAQRIIAGNAALGMSEIRKSNADKIAADIEEVLKSLGIQDSKVEIRIWNNEIDSNNDEFIIVRGKKYKFNEKGIDEVEFYLSTNIGEDPKPLVKIASGGEISRIMLALKSILAKNDKLPLLIFDEIDSGISGRIGSKVGKAMKSLAAFHQIIAITHLPQIAAMADHHFAVMKDKKENRVVSSIMKLSGNERVKEVAKLISGEDISEAALKGAEELFSNSK